MSNENELLIRYLQNLSQSHPSFSISQNPEILGHSLDYCSYTLGAIEQNIYACKTCNVLSGLCIGCCFTCHQGHEIIDIGPKKDFRCDCGLGKTKCLLFQPKSSNSNQYCHNFLGRFCVCDSTDSDFTRQSDMHMCVGCYDWFHSDCIQIYNDCHNFAAKKFHTKNFPSVPKATENYFLICEKCVNSNIFIINKFRDFLCLDTKSENYEEVTRYPYHVFVDRTWLKLRCECLECCRIEEPTVKFRSFKSYVRGNDREPGLEFRELLNENSFELIRVLMQENHEDQVHIAHGLVILRSMLQESLRTSFRVNFRNEVEALRKLLSEQRQHVI